MYISIVQYDLTNDLTKNIWNHIIYLSCLRCINLNKVKMAIIDSWLSTLNVKRYRMTDYQHKKSKIKKFTLLYYLYIILYLIGTHVKL